MLRPKTILVGFGMRLGSTKSREQKDIVNVVTKIGGEGNNQQINVPMHK